MRALAADRSRGALLTAGVTLVFLAAWATWFFCADVTLYAVTEHARVEVERASHPVDVPLDGLLVATHLVLGNAVGVGDVLVELDAESQRRQVLVERAQLETITPQLVALRRLLAALETTITDDRKATTTALDEARARREESQITALLSADEAMRAARLADAGAIAELEWMRTLSEARKRRAAAEALSLDVLRQRGDQVTRESERRAHIEDLRRDVATLEGRRATSIVTIDALNHEVDRRQIRAAVAGSVGEIAELRVGAFVHEGQRVGVIVPPGRLKLVAHFTPQASLGRIRAGQPARARLDGFPWTQYGTVPAVVHSVALEPRDGLVRVELTVNVDPSSRIPLQHGLSGSVEVETERATPATVVMRAVGKRLTRPAAPPATSSAMATP